jgi:hypothetical protein
VSKLQKAVTLCVLLAAALVGLPLLLAPRPALADPPPVGCEWRWVGPGTGWVIVTSNCPYSQVCLTPTGPGSYLGETVFTQCTPDTEGPGKSPCGCGGR